MKPRLLLGGLGIACILALSAVLLRPRNAAAHGGQRAVPDTAPPTAPVVSSSAAIPLQDTAPMSGFTGLGSVQPGAQATLSASLPARIVAVPARRDQRVRRGQLLVELDNTTGRTQAQTAQAGILAAQAQLRKTQVGREAQKQKSQADVTAAQAGLRQAEAKLRQAILARDAARADELAERATAREGVRKAQSALDRTRQTLHQLEELSTVGGVSRSDLEGARTQVTVAQSDLETARAQAQRLEAGPNGGNGASYRLALAQQDVDAAQSAVEQARDGWRAARAAQRQTLALADQDIRAAQANLEQARAGASGASAMQQASRLVSPIDGVVTEVQAHPGETAQPGAPLVTVVSLTGLKVEALLPARLLAQLRVGQFATVHVDTQPNRAFPVFVSTISPVAEPNGRTFRVTFRFRDPVFLRPGQAARITLGKL